MGKLPHGAPLGFIVSPKSLGDRVDGWLHVCREPIHFLLTPLATECLEWTERNLPNLWRGDTTGRSQTPFRELLQVW